MTEKAKLSLSELIPPLFESLTTARKKNRKISSDLNMFHGKLKASKELMELISFLVVQ